MSKQKIVLWGLLLIILIGAARAYVTYKDSFQTITITAKSNFTFSLYGAVAAQESNAYDKNKLSFSTSTPSKHKVKRGEYVYVVTGRNGDYQTLAQGITIGGQPISMPIPSLNFTSGKLTALLSAENSDIKAAIQAKYPSQMGLYSIQEGKLYENGDWYGAKLVPNDPGTYDTLRIVLRKETGTWRVVTDPPEITISQPVYPNIPANILINLDNR